MTAAMTTLSGPDTSFSPMVSCNQELDWELDLNIVSRKQDGSLLTDKDIVTSIASKATLCWGGKFVDGDFEEHEFGPNPDQNPGPPFKVVDIILCDIPGQLWGMDPTINCLQRGFVMQAEEPNYKIRLEQGATVRTNRNESWFCPQWATGPGTPFAEDADDPFANLRAKPSKRFGLYEVHIDAQQDALKKVEEDKEFA